MDNNINNSDNNNNSNNYNQDIWQQYTPPTPETPKKPNYDTPALILGIVSAIFALIGACLYCCAPIVLVTGIIGIVFVFVTTKNGYNWNAVRITALILSIVSILGLILWYIYSYLLMGSFMASPEGQQFMNDYMNIINEMMSDSSFGGAYYE